MDVGTLLGSPVESALAGLAVALFLGVVVVLVPSLARRVQLPAGLLVAGLGAGLLTIAAFAVGDDVLERDGLTHLDRPVLDWVLNHRQASVTTLTIVITNLGGTVAMAVLAGVVVAWLTWRGCWRAATLVAATAVGAGVLVVLTKMFFGRARPAQAYQLVVETNASFPSGHTLGSTAVVGVVTAVLATGIRHAIRRIALVAVAVVFIAAVGLSRLYLGVHWPTDVLAGWSIGGAWLAACLGVMLGLRCGSCAGPQGIHRFQVGRT